MPEGDYAAQSSRSPMVQLREEQSNHPHLLLTAFPVSDQRGLLCRGSHSAKDLYLTQNAAPLLYRLYPLEVSINSVLPLMPDWVQSASPYINCRWPFPVAQPHPTVIGSCHSLAHDHHDQKQGADLIVCRFGNVWFICKHKSRRQTNCTQHYSNGCTHITLWWVIMIIKSKPS